MTPDLHSIARALGGEVEGDCAAVPTPGHSAKDRGTVIKIAPDAPGGVLVHSFNGGDPLAIKDTLRAKGLLPERDQSTSTSWRTTGTYDYTDANGAALYRTVRKEKTGEGKRFVAERLDAGRWVAGMGDAQRVLYRLPDIAADTTKAVYLVEGERKADKLASWGLTATAVAFGSKGWRKDYGVALAGRTVIILPDNDEPGRDFAERAQRDLAAAGCNVRVIGLPGLEVASDIMDWRGTPDDLAALVERAFAPVAQPEPRHKFGSMTASALGLIKFSPLEYVIPGLLPEGLAIVAGKPKFGKSFAALDMGIAVATGGKAFGSIPCEAGDVLYCALEDSPRRLQDRLRGMLPPGDDMPERLHLETTAKRLDDGLIDDLTGWLFEHPDARLLIIDTWRCIKPASTGRASAYDEDASGLNPLHELAKAHPGLAVLVIHHTRKLEADDPFDTISGTHGLTGVADTLLVLAKHGEGAKLCGQGRDIDGYEKALTRNTLTGSWRIVGDAREMAKTSERQAILDVLDEAEGEVLSAARIGAAVGKKPSNLSHLLKRLEAEGLIEKAAYGKYRSKAHSNCSNRSNYGDDDEDDNASLNSFSSFTGHPDD